MKMKKLFVIAATIAMMMAMLVAPVSAASKTPGKVSGLKVTKGADVSVTLAWKKAKNAKKYEVKYKISSSKKWKTVRTSKKTAVVKKLKANTKYNFKVRGINGSKKGKYSKTLSFKTFKTPGKVDAKGIYAKWRDKDDITIAWDAASNASWYEVETYRINSDSPAQIDAPTATEYETVITMKPNSWYGFRVRSVNAATGKYPAIKSAWSSMYYTCTVSGDREITGKKEDSGKVIYTMDILSTFTAGEDDGLIPTGVIVEYDEHNDPDYIVGELKCNRVKLPSGSVCEVGKYYGSDKIAEIIVSQQVSDEGLTGYSQISFLYEGAPAPTSVATW